jgi:hypothetical protein
MNRHGIYARICGRDMWSGLQLFGWVREGKKKRRKKEKESIKSSILFASDNPIR